MWKERLEIGENVSHHVGNKTSCSFYREASKSNSKINFFREWAKDHEEITKDMQMLNKHINRCSKRKKEKEKMEGGKKGPV